MTQEMKAVLLKDVGGDFEIVNYPVPAVKSREVRVKVIAAGLNPLDIKISKGLAPHAQHPLPAILGMDMAGVVDAVGSEVVEYSIGDKVFGLTGGVGGHPGALAEYQTVDVDLLAKVPESISLHEAASIPLIFITAWEGLVDRANVSSSHKVLIHGGAGGVGHMAIQIALAKGASVFATVKRKDFDVIQALGATPIDYEKSSVEQYVDQYTQGEGFDIVYDTVGGDVLDNSFKAVRMYTGHVVSCLGRGTHSLATLSLRAASYSGVFTLIPLLTGHARKHHQTILKEASALVESKKLRVFQSKSYFTLASIKEAYQYMESELAKGKIVVDVALDEMTALGRH